MMKNVTKNVTKKSKTRKRHVIGLGSVVRSLALKFHIEQVPGAEDDESARSILKAKIEAVDNPDIQIIAVMHNKDEIPDPEHFWATAKDKMHFHIIIRLLNGKSMRVSQLLDMVGVYYRPIEDDEMWAHHGVEQVGDYSGYALYLTHETADAIADGKYVYNVNDLFSNLPVDTVEQIRNRATKADLSVAKEKDMSVIDAQAYKLGTELGNFAKWYGSLSYEVRSNFGMKTVKESYERGIDSVIDEQRKIVRLCVFIQGKPDTGKTYTSRLALDGRSVYLMNKAGTGKFDELKPYHEAMIIDDQTCPNLLNIADNYICRAYKRNHGDPAWTGNYLIVTSNLSFFDWLDACKIEKQEHIDALYSRFFLCHMEKDEEGFNRLVLDSYSERGSAEEQIQRLQMFKAFRDRFDEKIKDYNPKDKYVSLNDLYELAPEIAERELKEIEREVNDEIRRIFNIVKYAIPYSEGYDSELAREVIAIQKDYAEACLKPSEEETAEELPEEETAEEPPKEETAEESSKEETAEPEQCIFVSPGLPYDVNRRASL